MKPFVPPPEALAREAYLARCLEAAATAAPSKADSTLQKLGDPHADPAALAAELEEKGLVEEAFSLLRAPSPLRTALAPLAVKAKAKRSAGWAMDPERVRARLRFCKRGEASQFAAMDLQTLLVAALRLEGIRPCLDLGKRPRPLVLVAPPLPSGVEGDAEWAEVELPRSAGKEIECLLEGLKRRLPEGLLILGWEEAPSFASPIAELCERAHWGWHCPADQREAATKALEDFLASEAFDLEKVGKVEGAKQEKRVDLRAVVERVSWEGGELRFTTRLGEHAALNPAKLLGAILGREPGSITGLRRLGFEMAPDPRLAKAGRYQTKLKNIYEDAVLLGSGSNITLVEDDDDEPIQLG